MFFLCDSPQYVAAVKNEQMLQSFPEAMNFSSAEPCFLHPCYTGEAIKKVHVEGFGKLNTISTALQTKMRDFLARKIGVDVPIENFVYSLSTFRTFKAVLNCLPKLPEYKDKAAAGTVFLSPQGAYYLFNRIAGGVLKSDDSIETIWTHKDERYKLCAEDIQTWAEEHKERLAGRPLLLILENPSICGHLYTAEELKDIDAVCRAHNIYVFTDEVYRETYHPGEAFEPLAPHVKGLDNIISVFALSKSYGNLQYSLSFARMSAPLRHLVLGYLGDDWRSTTLHHNFITEAIIDEQDTSYLDEARATYAHKKKIVTKHIEDLNTRLPRPLKMIYEPQAGYATVIDFTEAAMGVKEFEVDEEFPHHMDLFARLAEAGLVLQSLHASGVRNRLCFRMVYGNRSEEEIARAFQIIESVLT